jgi:hypothetical protein
MEERSDPSKLNQQWGERSQDALPRAGQKVNLCHSAKSVDEKCICRIIGIGIGIVPHLSIAEILIESFSM